MRIEEKRNLGREFVNLQSRRNRGLDVRDTVRKRKRNFLHIRRAGFANVVPGDGDHIPIGNFRVAPGE